MQTTILPIRNMCDFPVGNARVTINSVGHVQIEPFEKTSALLLYLPNKQIVHMYTPMFGLEKEIEQRYTRWRNGGIHTRILASSPLLNQCKPVQ